MSYIGSKDVSPLQKTSSGSIVYFPSLYLTLSIDVFTWYYTFATFFRHEGTIVSTDTLSFLSRHRIQHHHDDQETRARWRNTSQAKIVLHQNFQTSLSRHARKPRHQCRTVQPIQSHTCSRENDLTVPISFPRIDYWSKEKYDETDLRGKAFATDEDRRCKREKITRKSVEENYSYVLCVTSKDRTWPSLWKRDLPVIISIPKQGPRARDYLSRDVVRFQSNLWLQLNENLFCLNTRSKCRHSVSHHRSVFIISVVKTRILQNISISLVRKSLEYLSDHVCTTSSFTFSDCGRDDILLQKDRNVPSIRVKTSGVITSDSFCEILTFWVTSEMDQHDCLLPRAHLSENG